MIYYYYILIFIGLFSTYIVFCIFTRARLAGIKRYNWRQLAYLRLQRENSSWVPGLSNSQYFSDKRTIVKVSFKLLPVLGLHVKVLVVREAAELASVIICWKLPSPPSHPPLLHPVQNLYCFTWHVCLFGEGRMLVIFLKKYIEVKCVKS